MRIIAIMHACSICHGRPAAVEVSVSADSANERDKLGMEGSLESSEDREDRLCCNVQRSDTVSENVALRKPPSRGRTDSRDNALGIDRERRNDALRRQPRKDRLD